MTDDEIETMALAIMAAEWIKAHAKDMIPVGDKLRLAAAVARVTQRQTQDAAAAMLQGLIDVTPDAPPRLRLLEGSKV